MRLGNAVRERRGSLEQPLVKGSGGELQVGQVTQEMNSTEGLCRAIREEGLLIRLLDGDLPPNDEHAVLTHLRTCHECLGLTADLLYTDSRLKDMFARQEEKKDKQQVKPQDRFMLEVDKLPVGKSLDKDLLDEAGKLLVAAGTELTTKLIGPESRTLGVGGSAGQTSFGM